MANILPKKIPVNLRKICRYKWGRDWLQGRIQDFKLGGAHLNKLCRTEGGAKIVGVFRVKKITILLQKIIFFPIAEGGAKIVGVFRVKNHDFTPKNDIFSNFRVHPPLDPPLR